MRALYLLVFPSLLSAQSAGDSLSYRWLKILDSKTGSVTLAFDTIGIMVIPGGVAGWFLSKPTTPGTLPNGKVFSSFVTRIAAHCSKGEAAIAATHWHDTEGNELFGYDTEEKDWKFAVPAPDTMGEAETGFLCAWGQKRKIIKPPAPSP